MLYREPLYSGNRFGDKIAHDFLAVMIFCKKIANVKRRQLKVHILLHIGAVAGGIRQHAVNTGHLWDKKSLRVMANI